MKKKRNAKVVPLYNTDVAAKKLWLHLLEDFRLVEGPGFAEKAKRAMLAGVSVFRDYSFPELGNVSVHRFRAYQQLKSLHKKYLFTPDVYTKDTLFKVTHDKFMREQEFFSVLNGPSYLGHEVLRRARTIARRVLGKFSPEDTLELSRFGKKSSIGCPLSLAYIDHKLTDARAFSGSSECSRWFFDEVVSIDPILDTLVTSLGVQPSTCENLQHDTLSLVYVPKTWKSYRPITPLTLLALYYSYGVGEQVTERLRVEGLDISRSQERHRRLIRKYSMNLSHATADLSSASQSLRCDLLNRILPREWYCALKKTFTHQLIVKNAEGGEVQFYTESVMPMGNGATFPVETIVFYVILKAIAELAEVKGVISVYGDDLIYPSRMHKFVSHFFSEFKFMLNLDKTFVKAPFRESCGSDFYHGVDSRPAFLPEGSPRFTRINYLSWLYKVYNSLLRRWDSVEIPSAFRYLLEEMSSLGLSIHRVPPCFPDTAGVKVSSPAEYPQDTRLFPWSPISCFFRNGSRDYSFQFLTTHAERRVVVNVLPYFWLALQRRNDRPEKDNFWDIVLPDELPVADLHWLKVSRKIKCKDRNGVCRTINRVKFLPMCTRKNKTTCAIRTTNNEKTGPISDWI